MGKQNMRKAVTAAAVLAVALIGAGRPAFADPLLDFDFTFTGSGGYPGTVSGEIEGLTNNATSRATAVFITSATISSPISSTYNTVQNAGSFNSFTVTNGVITAVTFYADNASTYSLVLGTAEGETKDEFVNLSIARVTENPDGLSGITFTPVAPSAVPEPGALALFAPALLGIALFRRRKRA
jgi:hypothetical protein